MKRSGVATYVGKDDESTLDWVKILLSYLPENNDSVATRTPSKLPQLSSKELDDYVPSNPNKGYAIYGVVDRLVDAGSFFELQEGFAQNVTIGFARIDGVAVGLVANNPKQLAGCLDVDASDKAARFVRFCDAFNIPLLTLVDVPGFLPGTDQEYNGIIRHGAKLLYAYSEATVPKLTVIMRKAYGGAYICMCSKHLGADMVVAWPGSEIAVMGPKGAVNVVFRKEITEAENKEVRAKELEQEYTDKFANPQMAASLGYIDNVIEPNQTRDVVINYLRSHLNKRQITPRRKHGNIPL